MLLQTERLTIRHLTLDDAAFILQLLNEPSFLRFIGDRDVRTLDDAGRYIVNGPMASYMGFAFLPAYWSQGYAFEAATAVLAHGRDVLGLNRIVAIANSDNVSSAKLLERLGLRFEHLMRLPGESEDVKYFAPAG